MLRKILILGGTGMLGHMLVRRAASTGLEVVTTARAGAGNRRFLDSDLARVAYGMDATRPGSFRELIAQERPDVVVNCIGVVKREVRDEKPLPTIQINSEFPHYIADICKDVGAYFVHISTDCVFSGHKGFYRESDPADASDIYGCSKFLGEVNCENCVTLRTSIIGHELGSQKGLLEWFLAQDGVVPGYDRAIFSGLSTLELANITLQVVKRTNRLNGLFHVAGPRISKHDLLNLVAQVYGRETEVVRSSDLVIDRSLIADRFNHVMDYVAPDWPEMIRANHEEFLKHKAEAC